MGKAHLLAYFLIYVTQIDCFAQESITHDTTSATVTQSAVEKEVESHLEIVGGPTYLLEEQFNPQMHWGGSIGIRMRFVLPNEKISISPVGNFRAYAQKLPDEPEVNNSITIVKTGLLMGVLLYQSPTTDFSISNLIELNYSWLSNSVSWKAGYSYTGEEKREKEVLYRGESLAVMIGYRMQFKYLFVEAGYDLFSSNVHLNKNVFSYTDESPRISTNTFTVNFGINVPLSELNSMNWGNSGYRYYTPRPTIHY